MSEKQDGNGSIGWIDLTVENADEVRRFYSGVAGWKSDPVAMDGYDDYCMIPSAGGDPVAGVCHKRGSNAGMPPQWMIYITVADLDHSIAKCRELGGKLIVAPRNMGNDDRYCVIEDPAGAVAALYEKTKESK